MPRPITYRNGDIMEYTGEVREDLGVLWYVGVMKEGHRKGQEVVTMRPPFLGPAVPDTWPGRPSWHKGVV